MAGACLTWSVHADEETRERARRIAATLGLQAVPREEATCDVVVVVEKQGAYALHRGERFESHPGMGLVRVRRLVKGDPNDHLVKAAGFRQGDTVLDATFGLGHDALVAAQAVGPEGRVVATEANPVLVALGLAGMPSWHRPAGELSRRIELRLADHRALLPTLPDHSFDVVVFDPMFRHPKASAPGFDLVRVLGEPAPLTPQTLAEARRVARRRVVVKAAWPGRDLERLGLERLGLRNHRTASFLFGVIDARSA